MDLLQEIHCNLFSEKNVSVYVLRLDLIDKVTGGNKYFKLKYNLTKAKEEGCNTLLSFGGAYSNHIAALAAEGKAQGFKTIGIIRGEELSANSNETLKAAAANGMEFFFVSRELYRHKADPEFINELQKRYGSFYLVPEGGSNALAVKGCSEIINLIDKPFDYIIAASGTGGTIAGIAMSLRSSQKAIGIPVLKKATFLEKDILRLQQSYIQETDTTAKVNLPELIYDYHFGGYADADSKLIDFKKNFETEFGVMLDGIYNSKSFYALFDLIRKDYFPPGSTIVMVHTGGLQTNYLN